MWGKTALINLYECDTELIKNSLEIRNYIKQSCKKMNMKMIGSPKIKRFGKGDLEGFSFMQFIETSSITGHFDETEKRAFIDVFSCKEFNEKKATEFSKEFFKAKKSKCKVFIRK